MTGVAKLERRKLLLGFDNGSDQHVVAFDSHGELAQCFGGGWSHGLPEATSKTAPCSGQTTSPSSRSPSDKLA